MSNVVFSYVSQLLDLCIININSLDFEYGVLAASVLSHFIHQETVEKVSGKIHIVSERAEALVCIVVIIQDATVSDSCSDPQCVTMCTVCSQVSSHTPCSSV